MKKEFKSTGVGAVDAALYAQEKRVEDGTENSGCFIQRQYPQIDPNYKLTIEDAIEMYTKSAQEHPELKDMHTQVAEWLKELVELRKKVKPRKKKDEASLDDIMAKLKADPSLLEKVKELM